MNISFAKKLKRGYSTTSSFNPLFRLLAKIPIFQVP